MERYRPFELRKVMLDNSVRFVPPGWTQDERMCLLDVLGGMHFWESQDEEASCVFQTGTKPASWEGILQIPEIDSFLFTAQENTYVISKTDGHTIALNLPEISLKHAVIQDGKLLAFQTENWEGYTVLLDLNSFEIILKIPSERTFQHTCTFPKKVVFDLNSQEIACIDTLDHRILWRQHTDTRILSLISNGPDSAGILLKNGSMGLLNSSTGLINITRPPDPKLEDSVCSSSRDSGVILSRTHLSILNVRDFTIDRAFELPHTIIQQNSSFRPSKPLLSNTHAFFLDYRNPSPTLYALNLSTGEIDWTEALPAQFSAAMSPGIVGDRLYLVDMEGGLHVWEGINL